MKVKVLLTVAVLPSAIVSVEPVAGAVIATLLIEVAVATPSTGVVSVLFVRVSDPARVARVPVVGSVILVAPVDVRLNAKFPDVVKLFATLMLPFRVTDEPAV